MAIRRPALELTNFRTDVGRKAGGHIRGSETGVFRDLARQGICGVWVPRARVGHHIPASRATLRYLWKYYHGSGRGGARLDPSAIRWRAQLSRSLQAARRLVTDPRCWPAHLAALAKETGRLRESATRRSAMPDNRGDASEKITEPSP
jgi:hypothetical protein